MADDEGPDLDALFGDGDEVVIKVADARCGSVILANDKGDAAGDDIGHCGGSAAAPRSRAKARTSESAAVPAGPHPALSHAVSSVVFGDSGRSVRAALVKWATLDARERVVRVTVPFQNAARALATEDWPTCVANAELARGVAWSLPEGEDAEANDKCSVDNVNEGRPSRDLRSCERDLYIFSELLLALCASAAVGPSLDEAVSFDGEGVALALRHADRALMVRDGPGDARRAALLFVTLFEEHVRRSYVASLSCDFPKIDHADVAEFGLLASPVHFGQPATRVQKHAVCDGDIDALRELVFEQHPFVLETSMLVEAWPALAAWSPLSHLEAAIGHRELPIEVFGGSSDGVDGGDFGAVSGTPRKARRLVPMRGSDFLRMYIEPDCQRHAAARELGHENESESSEDVSPWVAVLPEDLVDEPFLLVDPQREATTEAREVRVVPVNATPCRSDQGKCGGADMTTAVGLYACIAPKHALLEQCPMLRSDVPTAPDLWRPVFGRPSRTTVWIGSEGSTTECCCDEDELVVAQVQGVRCAVLLPPEVGLTCFGHRCVAGDGVSGARQKGGGGASCDNKRNRKHATLAVDVNLEAPGIVREWPRLALAHGVQFVYLLPGETLSVPRGWWLQMRACTTGCSVLFWF
eukprot:TRINITY_DN33600_c0_g1_i1.p1 TRINITY_DN33600_c0_g1~~TRINITY_DN33600_c0_g1_i1.p1  ORF type:complete len:649 (+),score=108.38 TRINITY_DN33600_c0_g1_i1:29-1948(+)